MIYLFFGYRISIIWNVYYLFTEIYVMKIIVVLFIFGKILLITSYIMLTMHDII